MQDIYLHEIKWSHIGPTLLIEVSGPIDQINWRYKRDCKHNFKFPLNRVIVHEEIALDCINL